jgi:DNA-binding response OmpR family regulator
MKVLLVDDEKELIATLAERLSFRGFEVDFATTAEAAIQMADNKTYDLAVLDIKMPKIRGFDIKKMLETKQPKMKFLFMTGHGSEKDFQTAAAQTGEEFYLVKPVQLDMLIRKMEQAMKKQGDS